MRVLDVGGDVVLLRFLPDSRRLFVATADESRNVTFAVLSLADGGRVSLDIPGATLDSWAYHAHYGNAIALSPTGDLCYLAWDSTVAAFRTADGNRLRMVPHVRTKHDQVVASASGDHLLAVYGRDADRTLYAISLDSTDSAVSWRRSMPPEFIHVAGFLPDGERFVTVDLHVRIRTFATGDEVAASQYRQYGRYQPQISTDGRHLALLGYGNMYLWDLTTLDKPRKIGGSSSFGDFRSFAFHPDNRRMAVIHGGPTLVKVYDVATLKQVHKWQWKLGPLRSVAYSPDGTLGAAGSVGGQIVVWDEDA